MLIKKLYNTYVRECSFNGKRILQKPAHAIALPRPIRMAFLLSLIFTLFLLSGCPQSVVEPLDVRFVLTTEGVDVTEAYIHIKATGNNAYGTILTTRDGSHIIEMQAKDRFYVDTTILERYLSPNYTYIYKAYYCYNSTPIDSSGPLIVTTMDTSKSDFVWSVYSIGDLGSLISDVAIISDTCIIAVGEIYVGDSLYNAVRWNGNSWDYLKIPTRVFGGNIRFTQLRAIEAFSENEWWTFSSAGSYSHWDGSQWKTEYLIEQSGGGRKLWGTSSSNLYLGGTNGSLSYFNGSFWQKMETCTTLDINDIYGTKNEKTGEYEILAVASSPMTSYERIILQISGASATTKADSGISTSLTGIWFVPNVRYYTVGGGIFYKRNLTNGTHWGKNPGDRYSLYYKYAIRGNGLNDVFVACGGGDILHFNGDSWKNFRDQMPPFSGFYSNLAIRKNTLVAVGYKDGAGVIAVGKR